MFALVLRLETTSPSFEYKWFLKNRLILYFKTSWRYQHLVGRYFVSLVHWAKKGLDFRYTNGAHQVFYMCGSLSFTNGNANSLAWPHQWTSTVDWVQHDSVSLPYFIEVSVPSQKRVNGHVCACCAHRLGLCLNFYVFLIWVLKLSWWHCDDLFFIFAFG
jgi:hypothetical protein